MKKLRRSKKDKVVAGVFGGMGEYFQIDPVIFRLIGVMLFFFSGFIPFILAYIIAIVIIPEEGEQIDETLTEFPRSRRVWLWIILIIFGFFLVSPILAFLGFRSYAENIGWPMWENPFFSENHNENFENRRIQVAEEILPAPERSVINRYLAENILTDDDTGEVYAEHYEFGRTVDEMFLWAYIARFETENDQIEMKEGISLPVVIKISNREVTGHSTPRDGSYYPDDVREMFPDRIADNVLNFQKIYSRTLEEMIDSVKRKAEGA